MQLQIHAVKIFHGMSLFCNYIHEVHGKYSTSYLQVEDVVKGSHVDQALEFSLISVCFCNRPRSASWPHKSQSVTMFRKQEQLNYRGGRAGKRVCTGPDYKEIQSRISL